MPAPILTTKLYIPTLRVNIVLCSRIMRAPNQNNARPFLFNRIDNRGNVCFDLPRLIELLLLPKRNNAKSAK